jgi:hypothetical protein
MFFMAFPLEPQPANQTVRAGFGSAGIMGRKAGRAPRLEGPDGTFIALPRLHPLCCRFRYSAGGCEMATNVKDGKTAKSSKGTHGGNRAGDQAKKDDVKKSSQAAGKDPNRDSR